MNVEGINIYAQLKEGCLSVSAIHLLKTLISLVTTAHLALNLNCLSCCDLFSREHILS